MIYDFNLFAVIIFAIIVVITVGISFYFGAKAKSASGFFAAGGQIHWFVNGIAFAGDYLSAASFLGICGMIAVSGYDGFLYSVGYLAGWIVALFVIAEPLKRMGKFTFADALDYRFNSKAIKLTAAISTLVVSIFYLIPQMVGAGVLITPLFGLPHYVGVLMVGFVVIVIVVTAGMVSTTYVQFLKGGLLVVFSALLTVMILNRGFHMPAENTQFTESWSAEALMLDNPAQLPLSNAWKKSENEYIRLENKPLEGDVQGQQQEIGKITTWAAVTMKDGSQEMMRCQTKTVNKDGTVLVNGAPHGKDPTKEADIQPVGHVKNIPIELTTNEEQTATGPLTPITFFSTLHDSEVILWEKETIRNEDGSVTTVYFPKPTAGSEILRPGNHPRFKGIRSDDPTDKLNFLSLMLALFCGTAALPHILIRYYTVKDQASARKSTIVGIGTIGFFYVLTLFLGLGAMTSGGLDITNSNMAAPLLAKSMGNWLFAVISAIAFTTVLGTVSGLIVASSGAIVHDLMGSVLRIEMSDRRKVRIAKIASVAVGGIAILLGILFETMNVSYLVGWAFSIAASANLPALVMLLFWRKTTKQGISVAIVVGMISSLAWILLSGDTYAQVYGLPATDSIIPFSQPGIVTIPLGFLTLIVVSLFTQPKKTV